MKRASQFKSGEGRQFSRLLRSRGVRISGINAGYTMFRGSVKGLNTLFASFPFTSPPVRHRVPSHFNWNLLTHRTLNTELFRISTFCVVLCHSTLTMTNIHKKGSLRIR